MSRSDVGVERLVDGVLLPGFFGTTVPDWLARLVSGGLAGVVYFSQNVESVPQAAALSAELHGLRDDVLVATDEEGGDVTRLETAAGSSYPGNAALGHVDDVALTEAVGRCLGMDLRAAGVDVDLAPTVDVNDNPDNPVIGVRSFGVLSDVVSRHSAAMVRGLQSAGVAACAKHFPGHGSTSVDSHLALPVVSSSLEKLRRVDLPPFVAAISAGVKTVMTAHIRLPVLDEDAPATLSPAVLSLLRDEFAFDGVIISDALDMHAIAHGVGMGPGAVMSLNAGADLLCIGNPANEPPADPVLAARWDEAQFVEVRTAVLEAVADGTLPLGRLEEARQRVAALAAWTSAGRRRAVPQVDRTVGADVARRALEVRGDVRVGGAPHVLDLRSGSNRAAGRLTSHVLEALQRRDSGVTGERVGDAAALAAGLRAADGRPVVVLVGEPGRDAAQASLLADVLRERGDAVVIRVGWPDDRVDLGGRSVTTWGSARANAEAMAELLLAGSGS